MNKRKTAGMDRHKAGMEVMDLFIRAVNAYNALEKVPVKVGGEHGLYHSERHMLDRIGSQPAMNVTEFAKALGVTKGAVSQVVKKLEGKGVVRRYKGEANEKEVFLELTAAGRKAFEAHQRTNEETIKPLIRELGKHDDDKVLFLVTMFRWINEYLDQSRKDMKEGF